MFVAEHSDCVFLQVANVLIAQWLVNFPETFIIMLDNAVNHPGLIPVLHVKNFGALSHTQVMWFFQSIDVMKLEEIQSFQS